MNESYIQLARLLRTKTEVLEDLAKKMEAVTGKTGVIERIVAENNELVASTLENLGLPDITRTADMVYGALVTRLALMDKDLYNFLDKPDLKQMAHVCGKLCDTAIKLKNPGKGFFIKKEKATEMLSSFPPQNLLNHFGYKTVQELVEKEGFAQVFASLRFAQENEWMHAFFDKPYQDLKPEDFEERDVELIVLDGKWLDVAEKFLKKKYHNVSHLKEYGILFITPIVIDHAGETSRMFTLMLHYLNEVPFYSNLFRKAAKTDHFVNDLQSLLRGDVPEIPTPKPSKGKTINIRIVQRYLAKDNENDFRLLEPHINPEAEHWYRAAGDLGKLEELYDSPLYDYRSWQKLDFVGTFFPVENDGERLISFDLIDIAMSLAMKGQVKYLYHQEEALWNKIFIEYLGREEMNRLVDENIVNGFISL